MEVREFLGRTEVLMLDGGPNGWATAGHLESGP